MNKPTQYFVQSDIGGSCYALYRKRYENNGLFEEVWQKRNHCWKHIPLQIIWMQISGECTFAEVSHDQFKKLLPEAFQIEGW